jgi:solute carrier family 25 (adenine nucleotide translocator) protein 4/5/6/31
MKAQSNANDAGIVEKMATALVTGGLASALSKTAVAPFERIRLLLQTQTLIPGHSNEYKGVVDAFMRLPREQGVLSMWRGNIPNLLRIVPTYALRFSLFDYFQDLASIGWQQGKPLSLTRQMASGALSGFATVLVTYPLDLARTRMSAELTRASLVSPLDARPSSLMETLRVVVQHEGFFGLYRGLFISSLEITPYLAISLGNYLKLNETLSVAHLNCSDVSDAFSFLSIRGL